MWQNTGIAVSSTKTKLPPKTLTLQDTSGVRVERSEARAFARSSWDFKRSTLILHAWKKNKLCYL